MLQQKEEPVPIDLSLPQSDDYRLSFGTGGLYVVESLQLIKSHAELQDWNDVIEVAVEQNLLQFTSAQSTRRAVREICTRLKHLHDDELAFFHHADTYDQALLCWLACCRTYQFIGDFSTQVLVENFASYKLDLDYPAFDFFFDDQAQFHPELEILTETTRKKLRQILFRMLREARILNDDGRLVAAIASPALQDLNAKGARDLTLFVPGAVQ